MMARLSRLFLSSLLLTAAACTASTDDDGAQGPEDDLTSITARSRDLQFQGKVFVAKGSDDVAIKAAVKQQTQTAFGPLRTSNIAANSRELKDVDPATFVKRNVKVIDTARAGDAGTDMIEVTYTYKDTAVVDLKYATRSSTPLALMMPGYASQGARILTECTANDEEAREFASSIWYVFEPSIASCKTAMTKEQKAIDAETAKLGDARKQISKLETQRLYLPVTAKLGADKTNKGLSYPEYQKLYGGGVKSDKLIISMVYGLIDHDHSAGLAKDFNWGELMTNLTEVIDASDGWRVVAGPDTLNLSHFVLKSGKKVDNASIKDLVHVHAGDDSLGLSSADRADLDEQFANAVKLKWMTIERPVKVKIGAAAEKDFAVQMLVYFGAESDRTPHKFAIKNSDVFLYNGHSYIGYGPLDPSNFTAADFPTSYQILWNDGCVSYNYYEKDYIPLKQGGTKNLDLVTNAIEAPAWQSGSAMGKFVATLLNGQNATYRDLLQAAQATDPLRVVDGELDNEFTPAKYPITIRSR